MHVSIREVGPRDGLQNEAPVPAEQKVALLDALSGTGVSRIEAVSFVHPKAIPQMADAEGVWVAAHKAPGVPNERGAQRALAAGFTEIEVVVSASETHNRANVNRSTAESLDEITALISEIHTAGGSVEWAPEYEPEPLRCRGRGLVEGLELRPQRLPVRGRGVEGSVDLEELLVVAMVLLAT